MVKQDWIKKALALGLVFFVSILLVKPIGVSTQFSVLSGIIHNLADPSVISEEPENKYGYSSTNAYYDKKEGQLAKSISQPLNYDFVYVLAIPLGAFLGYMIFKKPKIKPANADQASAALEKRETKRGFFKKYSASFLSGFALIFGARLADGCTSGHMMSGMMQSSVSGYIFAAAVFAAAIPAALIAHKRRVN